MTRQRRVLLVLAAAVALGIVLRLLPLGDAWTPDEVALLQDGADFFDIVWARESGVNPPLHRLILNLPFDGVNALWWGRILSVLASLAALPLIGLLEGRIGGRGLSMALLAITPVVLEEASVARVYALLFLVGLVHLHLVVLALARGTTRWVHVAVGLTGALMVHLHYTAAIPVALTCVWLGLENREVLVHALLGLVPLVLPLVPLTLGDGDARHLPQPENLWTTDLFGLPGGLTFVVVLGGLAWFVPGRVRAFAAIASGTGLALAGLSLWTLVRNPVGHLVLLYALPFIGLLASSNRLHQRVVQAARVLAGVYVIGALFSSSLVPTPRPAEVAIDYIEDHPLPEVVTVHPPYLYAVLHFHLTGERATTLPDCDALGSCQPIDGTLWVRTSTARADRGWLITDSDLEQPACELLHSESVYIWDCGP